MTITNWLWHYAMLTRPVQDTHTRTKDRRKKKKKQINASIEIANTRRDNDNDVATKNSLLLWLISLSCYIYIFRIRLHVSPPHCQHIQQQWRVWRIVWRRHHPSSPDKSKTESEGWHVVLCHVKKCRLILFAGEYDGCHCGVDVGTKVSMPPLSPPLHDHEMRPAGAVASDSVALFWWKMFTHVSPPRTAAHAAAQHKPLVSSWLLYCILRNMQ